MDAPKAILKQFDQHDDSNADYIREHWNEAIDVYDNDGSMLDLDNIVRLERIFYRPIDYQVYKKINRTVGDTPPLPIGRIRGRHAWIESTHAKMVLNMVWIPDKEIVMFNSLDVLDDLVPVSELSNGRTAAVLNKADRAPVIIIKRNKPSYVLMGINDYQDLLDRLEDTEDSRLAEKRIEDNNGRATISNADLMAELGLTEEDIADTPTPEIA